MGESTNSSQSVVVDASVILVKLLPDEQRLQQVEDYYQQFSQNKLDFIAPELLKFEVTNALRSAVIRDRVTRNIAKKLLGEFLKLPIDYKESDFTKAFDLALKHNLSVYDASYVALALEQESQLVSLDKKLFGITT